MIRILIRPLIKMLRGPKPRPIVKVLRFQNIKLKPLKVSIRKDLKRGLLRLKTPLRRYLTAKAVTRRETTIHSWSKGIDRVTKTRKNWTSRTTCVTVKFWMMKTLKLCAWSRASQVPMRGCHPPTYSSPPKSSNKVVSSSSSTISIRSNQKFRAYIQILKKVSKTKITCNLVSTTLIWCFMSRAKFSQN